MRCPALVSLFLETGWDGGTTERPRPVVPKYGTTRTEHPCFRCFISRARLSANSPGSFRLGTPDQVADGHRNYFLSGSSLCLRRSRRGWECSQATALAASVITILLNGFLMKVLPRKPVPAE